MKKKPRHFLTLLDFSKKELEALLKLALDLKKKSKKNKLDKSLSGKILALVFEKSSTRTRVSFEAAMIHLGGHAIEINNQTSQLGRGETYEDTARVLSAYVDGIVLRTFSQNNLEKMASVSSIPIINGLTDLFHPVQIMAALLTMQESKKSIENSKIVYIGDGNNMANTWITAAMIFGFDLNIACPPRFQPSAQILMDMGNYPHIQILKDPVEAVKNADVIYTDTWFSMEQKEDEKKRKLFQPYQVNGELLSYADRDAIVLHCLPAHRDEEITSEILDGPKSRVFEEAENRLHVQKAILKMLLG